MNNNTFCIGHYKRHCQFVHSAPPTVENAYFLTAGEGKRLAGSLGVKPSIYAALRGYGLQFAMPTIKLNRPKRLETILIMIYHDSSRYIMMEPAMSTAAREKFSSQAAPEVLAALRQIAESQGRQFQAVLDEALRDYIDRQQKERPRRHVMAAFASSLDEFDDLYRELAK